MRFGLLAILVLAIPLLAVSFSLALPIEDPGDPGWSSNIIIVAEEITPEPVEPGQDLTVKVRIRNNGFRAANELRATLRYDYPFFLKSENQDFDSITLCPGCSKDNTYYLKVDSKATTGVYTLNFDIWRDDVKIKGEQQTVSIAVLGIPSLIFSAPSVGDIAPNSGFTAALDVTNIGTGEARRINVRPERTGFVVLGGDLRSIETLEPGKMQTVLFDFVAGENLAADVYNIPVKLEYESARGKEFNKTQNLGVRVIQVGALNIENIKITTLEGSTELHAGEQFMIVARIENIGDGEVDAIAAEIDCPLDGQKRSFVGKLKTDEDSPATFTLVANRKGYYKCDIILSYTDDLGPHVTIQKIDVYVGGNSTIIRIVIVIAMLALAGVGAWRYLTRQRDMAFLPDEKQKPERRQRRQIRIRRRR